MLEKVQIDKPANFEEFKIWFNSFFEFNVDDSYVYYYTTVVRQLKNDIEESAFWQKVLIELNEINDRYFIQKKVHLLTASENPKILTKSIDSLMMKAYRKNVLNNHNFPDSPQGGWITPDNWFESIKDIVRTTITVKYLDGVQFLVNELEKLTLDHGFHFTSSLEAREEGYYAAHSGIIFPLSMPDQNFAPIDKKLNIEIQITTQIQEIIKTLLHKHYEENRKVQIPHDYKWQWDHKSPEFTSNYLGHIIHYVEGMIVEIRDKESSK